MYQFARKRDFFPPFMPCFETLYDIDRRHHVHGSEAMYKDSG